MVITGVYGKASPSWSFKRLPYVYTLGVRCRTGDAALLCHEVTRVKPVVHVLHATCTPRLAQGRAFRCSIIPAPGQALTKRFPYATTCDLVVAGCASV